MDNVELARYVEKFINGETEYFENIYSATYNQVYNLIYSYVKDEQISYDLMQDTYLTVINKIKMLKDINSARAWINRVAINNAYQYLRKKSKQEVLFKDGEEEAFEVEEEEVEFLPQEILDNKETQKIIKQIIDDLPLEQKNIIYLYYFNEMSVHEIAEEIDCSDGTIKSRLNYARKKIKLEVTELEKREGTKLYSSGIGIIGVILRNLMNDEQIQKGFEKIILNNIKGKSKLGLKKSKFINKTSIKAIIGAGIAVGLVTGFFMYNNVQNNKKQNNILNNTNLNSEDIKSTTNSKKEIPCDYYSYYKLGLSGSISEIRLDDDIALVKDYPEDKCIGLLLDDSSRDGTTTVHIKDGNNNEVSFAIEVDVECESVGPSYNYDEKVWKKYLGLDIFTYKLVTTGNITKVYGYDEGVLKIENLEEERCIKITPIGEGKTTATFVDDKGAEIKYTAEIKDYSEYVGHEDYSIENSKIDTPYKTVDIIWLADN